MGLVYGPEIPFSYLMTARFRKMYPGLPDDVTDEAIAAKLHAVSVEARALYPDIDARLASGDLHRDTLWLVIGRVAERALRVTDEDRLGVASATAATGPFSSSLTYTNPDGNVYFGKADRRLLESGRRKRQAWTIHPGAQLA